MTENTPIQKVIASYPGPIGDALLHLRRLILETAEQTKGAGEVEETLKWGQPSFLTVRPKTGTTIRIDRDTSGKGDIALFVSCQSSLVSEWRALYPHLIFGGDRSVHFKLGSALPENELRHMISMALTYHIKKTR